MSRSMNFISLFSTISATSSKPTKSRIGPISYTGCFLKTFIDITLVR